MNKLKVYLFPKFRSVFELGFRVQRGSGPNGDSARAHILGPVNKRFQVLIKVPVQFVQCPESPLYTNLSV